MLTSDGSIRIAELILKLRDGQLSKEEMVELDNWKNTNPSNAKLLFDLTQKEQVDSEIILMDSVATDKAWKRFQNTVQSKKIILKRKPINRAIWLAAASILLIISPLTFYLLHKSGNTKTISIAKTSNIQIKPGGNKALLQLADGSTVFLDSSSSGNLAYQGSVKVIKAHGKIIYSSKLPPNGKPIYNSIITPKGGEYQLELSDGTMVWLNAASSIKYPVAFTDSERRVEITGEAYFEVAKNAKKPFRVVMPGKAVVEVLGTHFNINAYDDELTTNATLFEGAIQLNVSGKKPINLLPGQQARIGNEVTVIDNIDAEEVIAWKTGWFNFNRTDIASILRQVSRWYNVEMKFEGQLNKKTFSGVVSRGNNISEVLKIMEKAGVQFQLEGQKIIVKPQ